MTVKQAVVLDLMGGPVQGAKVMSNSINGGIHGNLEVVVICGVADGRVPLM